MTKQHLSQPKTDKHHFSTNSMEEILAPCGSYESLIAAIRLGADAVYVGSKAFSARQNAKNFDRNELSSAVEECHKHGVKIYQAINTVVLDSQMSELLDEIEFACEIGIDGLITQDLSLVTLINETCPEMPIHASTQMTLHTKNGVLWANELGFCRVVISREVSKQVLAELCKLDIEIEAFVHGALCMSVSGECYLSAIIGSRSANRGLCAGACRLPFSAQKNKDEYALSLKDMSYIEHLNELKSIGVSSFKIEGRMKRPEYTASCLYECKKALEGKSPDMKLLKSVFSRSGFTDGYFTSQLGKDMFGTRQKEDVISANDILPKLRDLYKNETKKYKIDFDIDVQLNKPIILTAKADGCKAVIKGELPQTAVNRPIDFNYVLKQLSKLGGSQYELGNLICNIDSDVMVSASVLNKLRRDAVSEIDKLICQKNTNVIPFDKETAKEIISSLKSSLVNIIDNPKMRISLTRLDTLNEIDLSDIEMVYVPMAEIIRHINDYDKTANKKLCISLPRYMHNEQTIINNIRLLKGKGFYKFEAANPAHLKILNDLGLEIHTGFGFNITNSLALGVLKDYNVSDAVVSFELKTGEINNLKSRLNIGIISYGKLPLMLCVNCPIKASIGCNNCNGYLSDRTGRKFKIRCNKGLGYYEMLNSDVLYMADKMNEFKNISFHTLCFDDETGEEINDIIKSYKNHSVYNGAFTRGLYFRGII